MSKYKKLRNTRPKALLGDAIIGAGISAAASLTAAGIQSLATDRAAKEQARAIQDQANRQAESMRLMNDNNNRLQEKMIEANRIENEKQNQIFNTMQMNLQMQQGQENEKERLNGARIQLKKGGKVKRLKDNSFPFLQGGFNNLPFQVIDGGGVVYLGTTPSGNDLYELYGDDHKHYHKTKGGKYKSGVGIKFANNQVIEGEGNQNGNQGELMLVGPTDARFISKHSLRGFNPAKAVDQGMTPEEAYIQQERIKSIYNIGDKDNTSSPVKRNKARYGWNPSSTTILDMLPYDNTFKSIKSVNSDNPTSTKKSNSGNYTGAWISAGANLLGAIGTSIVNERSANRLRNANTEAANIMINAINSQKGIDINSIRRSDFTAPHAMAAIRSANVNINPELALVDRSTQRRLRDINNNSASGAARLNRLSKAETDAYDMRSQIYSKANQLSESIHQQNANRLTQVSSDNANRDAQSRQAYNQAYLNLLQYNNQLENNKLLNAAQVQADAINQNASIRSNTRSQNWNNIANAVNVGAKGFTDVINSERAYKQNLEMARYGWSIDSRVQQALNSEDIDELNNLKTMLEGSQDPAHKGLLELINNKLKNK